MENLFHMLVKALPAGYGPAHRTTCVLNCQGVIMPWRDSELLHLCLSQLYYQTKYSRVHGHGSQFMHPFHLKPNLHWLFIMNFSVTSPSREPGKQMRLKISTDKINFKTIQIILCGTMMTVLPYYLLFTEPSVSAIVA